MFLVDTNVWLESLLGQERSAEADRFLTDAGAEALAITDFSLHSIAIILLRLERADTLDQFLTDIASEPAVAVLSVETLELRRAAHLHARFGLDFDDAYQYLATQIYGCTLVTYDADFDRTDLPRTTPADIAP